MEFLHALGISLPRGTRSHQEPRLISKHPLSRTPSCIFTAAQQQRVHCSQSRNTPYPLRSPFLTAQTCTMDCASRALHLLLELLSTIQLRFSPNLPSTLSFFIRLLLRPLTSAFTLLVWTAAEIRPFTGSPLSKAEGQLEWPAGGRSHMREWAQREGVAPPAAGFSNFTRTFVQPHCLRFTLTSEGEVQSFARCVQSFNAGRERDQRLRVRVAAGHNTLASRGWNQINYPIWSHSHAMTPCMDAHVVLHLTSAAFNVVEQVPNTPYHVRVGPNVAIGEIEERLWSQYGLFLGTSPVSPHLTVAGLTANGGHGTGRDQPSFPGLLEAVRFVMADGEVCELRRGVDADFATLFGAHLGAFGIILSLTLRARPAEKMKQETLLTNYAGLLEHAASGVFERHQYTTVLYTPTYSENEFSQQCTPNVQVMLANLVPVTSDNLNNRHWSCFSRQMMALAVWLADKLNIYLRLAHHSHWIPIYMRIQATIIRHTVGVAGEQVGPFHHVCHFITEYPSSLETLCLMIPVCGSEDIVRVLRLVQNELEHHQRRRRYPLVNCIFLRLIAGTIGGLSTSQLSEGNGAPPGLRFLCLDVMSNSLIPGFTELLEALERRLVGGGAQSKPHWGKAIASRDYSKIYGRKMEEFREAVERLTGDQQWMDNSFLVNPFLRCILSGGEAPHGAPDSTCEAPAGLLSMRQQS